MTVSDLPTPGDLVVSSLKENHAGILLWLHTGGTATLRLSDVLTVISVDLKHRWLRAISSRGVLVGTTFDANLFKVLK